LETVTALTRDDVVAAHKAALARDRIFVAAAGDITAEELGLLLDRLLGDLPATGRTTDRAPWLLPPGTTVVDFPTPQSTVFFGQRASPATTRISSRPSS
jgi:zinc protease